jgi:hypothetical protein
VIVETVTRTFVAYIAGLLISGEKRFALRDHDRKKVVFLDGLVENNEVKIYGHERNGYVSGLGEGGRYMLYQHGGEGTLTLAVDAVERHFRGCDHRSGFHFFGNMTAAALSLFDYQDVQWHRYTLERPTVVYEPPATE